MRKGIYFYFEFFLCIKKQNISRKNIEIQNQLGKKLIVLSFMQFKSIWKLTKKFLHCNWLVAAGQTETMYVWFSDINNTQRSNDAANKFIVATKQSPPGLQLHGIVIAQSIFHLSFIVSEFFFCFFRTIYSMFVYAHSFTLLTQQYYSIFG